MSDLHSNGDIGFRSNPEQKRRTNASDQLARKRMRQKYRMDRRRARLAEERTDQE